MGCIVAEPDPVDCSILHTILRCARYRFVKCLSFLDPLFRAFCNCKWPRTLVSDL